MHLPDRQVHCFCARSSKDKLDGHGRRNRREASLEPGEIFIQRHRQTYRGGQQQILPFPGVRRQVLLYFSLRLCYNQKSIQIQSNSNEEANEP